MAVDTQYRESISDILPSNGMIIVLIARAIQAFELNDIVVPVQQV